MKRSLLLLWVAGCSGEPPRPPAAPASPPGPRDSLVLTLPDSTSVWLVRGREGIAADGTPCHERSIELRKDGRRLLVPLLYTRSAPHLEHGKLYATLSNRCVDGAEYAIDPVTAYPTPRGGPR